MTNLFVLFFQNKLVKGPELQRQNYYPTPPTSVLPNTPERSRQMAVSPRTANALFNVQRGYWQTHYQQQFTGNGPQNILKLDNFDSICSGRPDVLVSDLQEMWGWCLKILWRPHGRGNEINTDKRPLLHSDLRICLTICLEKISTSFCKKTKKNEMSLLLLIKLCFHCIQRNVKHFFSIIKH